MNLFYDHLTGIDMVRAELAPHLAPAEIEEVLLIIDNAVHHAVMEAILSSLPEYAHDEFMARFSTDPSSLEHLVYLQQFNPNIEDVIRQASLQTNQRFLDTIHR